MDLLEALIARAGQAQEGRLPAGLAPHFADVEERSSAELFAYAKRLAAHVNFFDVNHGAVEAAGDWAAFFDRVLPAGRDGKTPPHLALLAAFLKLHRVPRCAMNSLTARHLDFFYQRVLGFVRRPPLPDRAHLVVELKKGAAPVAIGAEHAFSGGKDATGAERIYAPLAETVINRAKVESLRSVFVDPANGGTVCFAPVANSADGLGGELRGDERRWSAFGHADLPAAPIGFALASPVLRMKEGRRTVTLTLQLDGLLPALGESELQARLECFVTGEKRWLGPYPVLAKRRGASLDLTFTVSPGEEAIVDYDPARHAHAFAASAPVVQVLLKVEDERHKPRGYRDFLPAVVRSARVAVEVSGMQSLQLESDAGLLDSRRAFTPFGPQPVPGSRFMIGCPEALSKKLSGLSLELNWLGPPDFVKLYAGYTNPPDESSFTVAAALRDGAGQEAAAADKHPLFQPRVEGKVSLILKPGEPAGATGVAVEAMPARRIRAFAFGGSRWLLQAAERELLKLPIYGFGSSAPPTPRPGFITLKLDRDFGHTEYRARLLAGKPLANEPYTPTLSGIALSYEASSGEARVDSDDGADFANAEVEFFHVGCFGQRREHAWLRGQFAFVEDKRVPLLPAYEDEGELLIGMSELAAGDSVSLLFKVAEGSADPDVDPQPSARWAVLCDNYWKPLAGGDAVRDSTNNLLATGLVAVSIPSEASTQNSFLPAGRLWLKASVRRDVRGVCALVSVAASAIEVERRSGAAAERLWTPLPEGTIARLKTPVAAVKSVAQPFATFGGAPTESGEALNTRAAERLRHRDRAISAWDYERSVLAAFPEIRKAKCIPHCAAGGGWLDPGHVAIVVVPDLRLRNAVDPLQPRADADTLSRIRRHLEERSPMRIGVHARNPRYQRIRLDFKVRFQPGVEFNYHARKLREALIGHLSPWLHDPGSAIAFGGTVYKSQLLDFVEDTDYVDFVTDFRMYHLHGGPHDAEDVNEARAAAPDAILVSDATHDIAPVPDA